MAIQFGEYVGDGGGARNITHGLLDREGNTVSPICVIVTEQTDVAGPPAHHVARRSAIRMSTMAAGSGAIFGRRDSDDSRLIGYENVSNRIDAIVSGAATFPVGSDMNLLNSDYFWIAWSETPGEATVFQYTGNGATGRELAIQGANGQDIEPDLVIICARENQGSDAINLCTPLATTLDTSHRPTIQHSPRLIGIAGSTLTVGVGGAGNFNTNGDIYDVFAWQLGGSRNISTRLQYVGDGTDGRTLSGVGFIPDLAFWMGFSGLDFAAWLRAPTNFATDETMVLTERSAANRDLSTPNTSINEHTVVQVAADGIVIDAGATNDKNVNTTTYEVYFVIAGEYSQSTTITAAVDRGNVTTLTVTATPAITARIGTEG